MIPKHLVLLADRRKAIFFTVEFGRVQEKKEISNDDVPQNVKAKKIDWGRDDKIFRHIEQHLHYHLKAVSEAALDFAKNKNINFVMLGGHEELIPKIKKHLKYPLNKIVKGKFITELNIPIDKLLKKAQKALT